MEWWFLSFLRGVNLFIKFEIVDFRKWLKFDFFEHAAALFTKDRVNRFLSQNFKFLAVGEEGRAFLGKPRRGLQYLNKSISMGSWRTWWSTLETMAEQSMNMIQVAETDSRIHSCIRGMEDMSELGTEGNRRIVIQVYVVAVFIG